VARLLAISIIGLLAWVTVNAVAGEIDRVMRTETIDGFDAAGPIHLAPDGKILLAHVGSRDGTADGRIEAFDPVTRLRTTLLDGLVKPLAADVGSAGLACAIWRPLPAEEASAPVTCSDGRTFDLETAHPAGLVEAPGLDHAQLADIVSDGDEGWVVADVGRAAILHLDRAGVVALIATITQYSNNRLPVGLARSGEEIVVAIRTPGFVRLSVSDRGRVIDQVQSVGGQSAIAVVAGPHGPLVLVTDGSGGFVTYQGAGDAPYPRVVDRLSKPAGFVLLPDGRIAVADGRSLVLFRPAKLPN
jgi:hypothetical protein